MRSAKESRCGDRYAPVRRPCACRSAAIMRAVDDLPFVPTTWIGGEVAPAANRAPSSAGACARARSASRTAPASAGSARPAGSRMTRSSRPWLTSRALPARARSDPACRAPAGRRPRAPSRRSAAFGELAARTAGLGRSSSRWAPRRLLACCGSSASLGSSSTVAPGTVSTRPESWLPSASSRSKRASRWIVPSARS